MVLLLLLDANFIAFIITLGSNVFDHSPICSAVYPLIVPNPNSLNESKTTPTSTPSSLLLFSLLLFRLLLYIIFSLTFASIPLLTFTSIPLLTFASILLDTSINGYMCRSLISFPSLINSTRRYPLFFRRLILLDTVSTVTLKIPDRYLLLA